MKNLIKPFFLLSLSVLLYNCSSSEVPEAIPSSNDPDVKITYNKDVKTIVDNSCATSGCHSGATPPKGLSLTNFAEVKKSVENGGFHGRIDNNTMPPNSPLPSDKKNIINQWKAGGYLEK